ncbi:MAG TPA: MerR family transcriptional regulator [Ktedonobacteraceae bacterium]|jgi:DNA-binding transcriptional MerR regulator|nr:MerR family transcriptional regulator [Ktedonobacteraceae bacterium]
MMFKIGDFARIGRISVKTLHHYDDIGLLKPAHVDVATGYRYYTLDQLPRLNRILALKDLGFSLEQIASLLNEPLAVAELRGMLRLKRAELQRLVQAEQARLNRVEARLKQIETEGYSPAYDIIVKSVTPEVIVCAREIVPSTEEMHQRCKVLAIKIWQFSKQAQVEITGPMYSIYHNAEDYTGKDLNIDIEIGFGVERSVLGTHFPPESGVAVRELPGIPAAASLVHTGPYDGIWQAYTCMLTWIEINGYRRCAPFRHINLRNSSEGEEPITELQFPVEKRE